MEDLQWLPIAEYAVETGISVSTIRRKIKKNRIKYRMDGGRYLIHWNKALENLEKEFLQPNLVPPKKENSIFI